MAEWNPKDRRVIWSADSAQPTGPGNEIRPNPPVDAVTNTFPGMAGAGGNIAPQPVQQHDPNAYPPVGSANYDQYVVNDMLRDNGMNGWQMAGQAPIEIVEYKVDPNNVDAPPVKVPSGVYVVNAVDPRTKQVRQVKLSKVWRLPNGQITTTEQPGEGYGFQATQISDQVQADPTKVGHSNQMRIGDALFGTSNATGNFEEVPGSRGMIPKEIEKWSSVQQIQEPDGSLVWYGIDPADGVPKPINSMPRIPKEATGWGNPTQIERGGKLVWYGTNPTTKKLEPIPDMPITDKPPTGPGSITQGGTVYTQKPDGTYGPAPGIPDPNPPVGTPRNVLDSNGFIVQERYAGGGRWDFDPTFETVPYTDAAKQGRAATGALHKAGEPGEKVLNGMVYKVIYRGGGDDNYDFDTTVPAKPYPGTQQPILQTTGADQEFLVYRDPQDPTKQIKVRNPNYAPTDPAARRRLLSQQANTKFEELQARVKDGTGYTGDQAQRDFEAWWEQNITPESAAIDAAQRKEDIEQQNKIIQARTAAQTAALGAGTLRQRAVEDQQKRTVSGGFLEEMGKVWNATRQGQVSEPIDYTKLGRPVRDVAGEAERATAEALKYIDPTAAQIAGAPPPAWQTTPPSQALDRTRFNFSGAPVAAPAADPTQLLVQDPGWQQRRADQISGATPPGNALAPAPGLTGTVNPGDPNYLGMTADQGAALAAQQAEVDAQQQAQQAQTTANLQALMAQMKANDVYQYGGGAPVAPPVMPRRRPQPAPVIPLAAPGMGYDPSNIPLQFGANLNLPVSPYVYGGQPY